MLRLGGTFLAVNATSSSVKKGETLEVVFRPVVLTPTAPAPPTKIGLF